MVSSSLQCVSLSSSQVSHQAEVVRFDNVTSSVFPVTDHAFGVISLLTYSPKLNHLLIVRIKIHDPF